MLRALVVGDTDLNKVISMVKFSAKKITTNTRRLLWTANIKKIILSPVISLKGIKIMILSFLIKFTRKA